MGIFRSRKIVNRGSSVNNFLVLSVIIFLVANPSLAVAANNDPFRGGRDAVNPKQSLGVSQSSGAMTYSYPLVIPPGRNGMQPDLSLSYSSADKRTDSPFGYGWSMNLPYIERVNKIGIDKLFNQDRDHTFFTSSLSGELLPVKNANPVGGNFLGVSVSTSPLAFLDDISLDTFGLGALAGQPSVDAKPVPEVSDALVRTMHTFSDTFSPVHVYHPNEEREFNALREQAAEDAKLPRGGFEVVKGSTTSIELSDQSDATSTPQPEPIFVKGSPVWINSQEIVTYDTADGTLHSGEYVLQPDGKSYLAYFATATIETATSTYEIPSHQEGVVDIALLGEMKEIKEVGRSYVNTFSDGTDTYKVPISQDDYLNLNVPNPVFPKYSEPLSLSSLWREYSPIRLLSKLLNGLVGLRTAFAAISFDSANSFSSCVTGTSCTYSYTVTGTNTFLACNVSSYFVLPGAVTMSYGGAAMTEIGSQQLDSTQTHTVDTFYLKGAATGANSLVITTTNSMTNGFFVHCASYAGVDQTSPVGTSTQHLTAYPTCTSDNTSVTTTADNSWVVGLWSDDAGRNHSAGAGTLRTSDQQGVIIDTGPKTPAGSVTVTNIPTAGTGCPATGFDIKPNTNQITASGLQVEALTNPSNVSNSSPSFSAVYTHASSTPLATSYQIQISTSPTYANTFWDSGQKTLSSSTPSGQRTPLIYATTTVPTDGLTYYWRIKFWDQNGVMGAWSTSGDYFTMQVGGDYMAKVDDGSFMRYNLGADGTWTAYDKKGWKYTFGATSNGRIFDTTASSSIYRWYLERVTDPNGNGIIYNYTKDGGQVYPNYIDYTDHSGGSLYEVAFTKGFCDTSGFPCAPFATSSIYGFPVFTRYLISDITAAVNGQVIHRHTPHYTTGDNQSRVLLSSIQETGYNESNGLGGITLPKTSFSYQTSTSTWTEVTDVNSYQVNFDITNTANDDNGYRLFDVNGDGLSDWVQSDGTTKAIRFNTGNAWGSASSTWTVPLAFSVSNAEQGVRTADVDGDGLVDLISASSSKIVYLNNGATGWIASTTMNFPESFIDGSNNDLGVQIVDVNGDGMADVFRSYYASGSGTTSKVYISSGTGWTQDLGWSIPEVLINNAKDSAVRLYDYNGDGLVDIIFSPYPPAGFGGDPVRVYYNTGHGWQKDALVVSAPFAFAETAASISTADRGVRFADFNGDGCVDAAQGLTSITRSISISGCGGNAVGYGVNNTLPEYFRDSASDYGVRMDDVNGDGKLDVVRGFFDSGSSVHTQKVYLKNGNVPDLLSRVDNSKGGKTTVSYQSSARYFDNAGALANTSLPLVVQTARSITTDSGSFLGSQRVIATTTYDYQRGYYYASTADQFNRQFTGFGLVIEAKPNGAATKTYFHQGNSSDSASGEYGDAIAKAGRPYRIETLDGTTSSANLYSRSINKWARASYGDGRNFVKLVNTLNQVFDGDTSHRDTAASTTYDDLTGNVIAQESLGEVIGNTDGTWSDTGSDNATTTYTYAASSTLPAMSLPSRELVVDQGGATVKDSKFYYDSLSLGLLGSGNQTKTESLISGTTYASTTRIFDSYGNIATSTDALGNSTGFTYDGYNLFTVKVTNALGQQKLMSYDYSSGKVATTTDANNQTVVTVFDNLDRPVLEKIPDFSTPSTLVTKLTYVYTDSTTTASSLFRTDYVSSSTSTDSYVYTDGFGRTLQSKTEAESGNGWVTKDTFYNQIGSVASDTVPYFSASSAWSTPTTTSSLFTNYYYDSMGRAATVTDSLGTSVTKYSDWQVTAIDALGNKKDALKDAYGNLTQVVEYLSPSTPATTTYTWNRLGKMTKLTDALGNIRNFTYDTLGRLLKSEDLHTSADTTFGSSTRSYDAGGNVTSVLTPNNQSINYSYDKLNRQLTEDYTGATGTEVVYTYDTCTNGIGKLCKAVKQGSATTTYAYNPIGLITSEAKQIGTSWGTTTTSYLRNGAVNIAVYPDLSQVGYVYDNAGLLESVLAKEPSIATSSVVLSLGYSPAGQTSVIRYTNGVTATSTYDQTKKYRLTNKFARLSTTTVLQNVSYTYDAVGNITQVSDSASSSARKTVNYGYDSLYRLLTASSTAVATSTSPYSQTFAYDALGNMTSGPAGTYTYAGTGYANPDAATAIVTATTQGGGGSPSTSTPAFVQSAIGQSSAALASTVTNGNLVVVGVTIWNTAIPANAVTDNKGNTYTRIGEAINATTDHLALFYATNVTGGGSFTVSSSVGGTVSVHEYSGIATSSPLDKTASSTGSTGTALTSGAVTPAVTNELIFGLAWSELDGSSWTAGSGYTLRTQETNNNTAERSAGEDKVATTTSAVSATFTTGGSAPWTAMVATFKPLVTQSGGGSIMYATSTLSYDNAGNLLGNGTLTNTWDYHNYLTQTAVGGSGGTATSTIAVAATSSLIHTTFSTGPTTKTWTATTSGTDRLLVLTADVFQDVAGTGSITSATYGGVSLTKASSTRQSSKSVEIWYLKNPASGGNTMSVTVTGAHNDLKFSTISLTGVDQTAPLESVSYALGTSGNPSVSITTTNAGDALVATLHRHTTADATTSRTSIFKDKSGLVLGAASYHLATATGVYADTYTGSVVGQNWAMLMTAFKPSVTSGSSSTTLTYQYDENGKRVMLVDPTGTTTRYYSGLYQDTPAAYKKTKNIFVNGALLATFEKLGSATMTPYYVLTDPLNSASILMNASGVATQTLDYLPYGDVRVNAKQTSYDSDRKYLSKINDVATNLDYLEARYYASAVGKFVSQDPVFWGNPSRQNLSNPQSLNIYSYAEGNPIIKSDPTGNFAFLALIPVIAFVATVISGLMYNPAIAQAPVPNQTVNTAYYQAAQAQVSAINTSITAVNVAIGAPAIAKGTLAVGTAGVKAVTQTVSNTTAKAAPPSLSGLSSEAQTFLSKGSPTTVYNGVREGENVYTGISNDVGRRELEHATRFDFLQPLERLPTTNQARALEQANLVLNPHFENKINSISPKNPAYDEVVDWGKRYLDYLGQ